MKRDQIVSSQRRMGDVVISAQGLRAEESPSRRRRPALSLERRATTSRLAGMGVREAIASRGPGDRVVANWLPIQSMTLGEVWEACGTSSADLAARRALYSSGIASERERALAGWPCHPAYVYGSTRVSCAICVMSSIPDMEVGARMNPSLADAIEALEASTGQTFRPGRSLGSVRRCAAA